MAGTSHAGTVRPKLGYDLAAPFLSSQNDNGVGRSVFNQWTEGTSRGPNCTTSFFTFPGVGTNTPATQGTATTRVNSAFPGNSRFDATHFSELFFEHIHIVPKSKIEFGNILTLVEEEYEIYNAFRELSSTLIAITNNALPGVALPNVTPPVILPRQTSLLDPTTTGQTLSALGTIVKTKVQALVDGLATFDTNIVFTFSPGNEVELFVSGQRIVLIPMEYEAPTVEILAFLTDVIDALNGKEQRLALRNSPRQMFEVNYLLTENDRQRMQLLLMDWMDQVFGFPLWHEKLQLTAAVSAGATVYPVLGASNVDFRVGGLAIIFTDANTFDVINVIAKTDTTITAQSPSQNAYPKGATIMPLRTAVIRRMVSGRQHPNRLEEFRIAFEVTDNDTGGLVGSTTPGFWSLYNSRVLFSDSNVVDGPMNEQFARRVYRVDNETGVISQSSPWDKSKRSHQKGFVARNRAEIMQLRKLLLALRGRQKAFYIPTFIEDLTVKANLAIGTNTMDIDRIEYPRLAQNRHPKKIFRITFTDNSNLVRIVQSSVQVDSTTDRLTLDTTWPANRTVAEIRRVEFYELSRFDADEIRITYPRIGLAEVNVPVTAVFDDD